MQLPQVLRSLRCGPHCCSLTLACLSLHPISLKKLTHVHFCAGEESRRAPDVASLHLYCLSVCFCPAVMEIDAVGTFTMSRAAFPALQAAGSSCIINISATLHYGATWYQVHASAAKAAVDSITRSLALEWGEYGIRVNGVAPGPIKGTAGEAWYAHVSRHIISPVLAHVSASNVSGVTASKQAGRSWHLSYGRSLVHCTCSAQALQGAACFPTLSVAEVHAVAHSSTKHVH